MDYTLESLEIWSVFRMDFGFLFRALPDPIPFRMPYSINFRFLCAQCDSKWPEFSNSKIGKSSKCTGCFVCLFEAADSSHLPAEGLSRFQISLKWAKIIKEQLLLPKTT